MVTVQPTLFEPIAVVCAWGNRRNDYQQLRIITAVSTTEAYSIAEKIVA